MRSSLILESPQISQQRSPNTKMHRQLTSLTFPGDADPQTSKIDSPPRCRHQVIASLSLATHHSPLGLINRALFHFGQDKRLHCNTQYLGTGLLTPWPRSSVQDFIIRYRTCPRCDRYLEKDFIFRYRTFKRCNQGLEYRTLYFDE